MLYFVQLWDGSNVGTKMAVFTDRVKATAKARGIHYVLRKIDYFDKNRVKNLPKSEAKYITSGKRTDFLKHTNWVFDSAKATLKKRTRQLK